MLHHVIILLGVAMIGAFVGAVIMAIVAAGANADRDQQEPPAS